MPRRAPSVVALHVIALAALLLPTAVALPASASPPPSYAPPVDAPVVDPFRPPATRFGPGNRGLELGTDPGTEVRAAADGLVTFAGVVAGARHVTVLHEDGLRTSYSFLDRVDVVVGQRVQQGQVLGTTVGHLHLGVRAGDAYLDPASLFSVRGPRVELVPFDEPPGGGERGERSAIRQLIGGVGGALSKLGDGVLDHALAGTGATAAWLRDEGAQLLRTAAHYSERLGGLAQLRAGLRIWTAARGAANRECTAPGIAVAPPSERRIALLVGGLGSTSDSAAVDDIDTVALGYADPDVLRFSYAGGRTPDPRDGLTAVRASAYGPGDTQVDLRESGRRLADLVEDLERAAPGTTIDLYAHSQGGVITRLALIELERRHGAAWMGHLGLVATLATPHDGADLATALHAIGSTGTGSRAIDGAIVVAGSELDDDARSMGQLAETSDVMEELRAAPLPAGLGAVSIAARGDLLVPVPRTRAPGATQVVVPLTGLESHDALPGSPEAARELALALAGRPPTCTSLREALTDQIVGEGIAWAEDTIGSLGWYAAARRGLPLGG